MPAPRKLRKLGGSGDGEEGKGDNAEVQNALEEIATCQHEIDVLNERASEEILKVEQTYSILRKPFFEKRSDIIKRIPAFWATAFLFHPLMNAILEEDEEDCLHFLTRVEVEEFDDIKSGYRINFHFVENPYFENDVLIKEFHLDFAIHPASLSTVIRWKEGKDLTKKPNETENPHPGLRRVAERQTFFSWFTDDRNLSSDEIAEAIKDELWQNPLQYFLLPELDVESEEQISCETDGSDYDDQSTEVEDDDEADDSEGLVGEGDVHEEEAEETEDSEESEEEDAASEEDGEAEGDEDCGLEEFEGEVGNAESEVEVGDGAVDEEGDGASDEKSVEK